MKPHGDRTKIIYRSTPEPAAMLANVKRAMAITAALNRLTFNDADDVLIGPNVSIITAGHPLEPSERRAATIGKPIVIERNVWIAAAAIIIGGVTVGENSARVIRSIGD